MSLLARLADRLWSDHAVRAVVACEIEFYLHGASRSCDFGSLSQDLAQACALSGLGTAALEKEQGRDQYELALDPHCDPSVVAENTGRLKGAIRELASGYGLQADFAAKPFADRPGSGLHVHVHLEDRNGHNLFVREEGEEAAFSSPLLYSLGGLLASLEESMPFFAPHAASYARFSPGFDAPLTASWGTNNRTVAIRLPQKPADDKHIEHRVAGADADPALVIAVILAGIHYGLGNRCRPGEPVYGNAALPVYAKPFLPRDPRHALDALRRAAILPEYLGKKIIETQAKILVHSGESVKDPN